ncbi:YhjD/YihY/BrkB family envelope integrity protein [Mesorhizobium sp.]|uniref:YihY/virulence factor BrkB family protein n=1 Tax=Mesorhizobium sp. TaxID=1871066 RepID=UPI0026A7122D
MVNQRLPFDELVVSSINMIFSFLLITLFFAAIYKILPDRSLKWRDVAVGALVTALLFTIGKSLISRYIGSSSIANSYGAAGALMVVLLWVYYPAQIYLFGAEITRAYSMISGSCADLAPVVKQNVEKDPKMKNRRVLDKGAYLSRMACASMEPSPLKRLMI